jgi:SHOCT-like domain
LKYFSINLLTNLNNLVILIEIDEYNFHFINSPYGSYQGENLMDQTKNPFEDERLQILHMVEEGKLSAVEAVGLLNALAKDAQSAQSAPQQVTTPQNNGHFFRVRVTDTNTGRHKVMVTLPLSLMDWGMRLGARFSSDIPDINFQELSELMRTSTDGKLVDVLDEEDGEHVEIFID